MRFFKDEKELLSAMLICDPSDGVTIAELDRGNLKEITERFAKSHEKVAKKDGQLLKCDTTYRPNIASLAFVRFLEQIQYLRTGRNNKPSPYKYAGRSAYWLLKMPAVTNKDPKAYNKDLNATFVLTVCIGFLQKALKKDIYLTKGLWIRLVHELTDHHELSETAISIVFETLVFNAFNPEMKND